MSHNVTRHTNTHDTLNVDQQRHMRHETRTHTDKHYTHQGKSEI